MKGRFSGLMNNKIMKCETCEQDPCACTPGSEGESSEGSEDK